MAKRYAEGTQLYNLEEDPDELVNCLQEHEDVAAWLHELLVQSPPEGDEDRPSEGAELSDEAREKLRSLGYMQ